MDDSHHDENDKKDQWQNVLSLNKTAAQMLTPEDYFALPMNGNLGTWRKTTFKKFIFNKKHMDAVGAVYDDLTGESEFMLNYDELYMICVWMSMICDTWKMAKDTATMQHLDAALEWISRTFHYDRENDSELPNLFTDIDDE